ncbi:MAG: type II secretion system F family protein [Phycisphaerales bacterium]|jgi:general secretion pathway protein F/type IV pilus assembly protein PilC|nr:type II secretion system F family protein [Phycisphaerales bacterium]
MLTYRYTAMDAAGRRVRGSLSAPNEQAAVAQLEGQRLTPILVQAGAAARSEGAARGRRVGPRALGTAYQQLGDMLRAGVPLLRALRVMGGLQSQKRLAGVFTSLGERVADGTSLADAMAQEGRIFPAVHVAMVRAGERGGFLDEVMQRLGTVVLGEAELRGKVVGSLVYPIVLLSVGTIVLGVIFGVFVPMVEPLLDRLREAGKLPGISKAVFAVSHAVSRHGPITLGVIAVVSAILWRASKRPDVRRTMAMVQMRAPVIGPLTRSLAAARFCRMLGTMEGNGVPLLTAIDVAKDAAGNPILAEVIGEAGERVRAGERLSPALAEGGLMSSDVVEMIAVGEEAGRLSEVLTRVADTLEGRVERQLGVAVRLIEPLMLAMLAGVIAIVAAGLVLPIVNLSAVT